MKTGSLALATSVVWASLTAADPPPPYPRVSTSISIHPDSVPVLPDPDYHTWIVEEGTGTSEFSVDGINLKLAAQDLDPNEALGSFVGGVNEEVYNVPAAPFGQRFVGAGITTVAAEGSFKLTISGLPDGQYYLSTWFNAWEEIERPGSVFVYKNGLGNGYVREQTSRAATVFEAAQDMVNVQGGTTEIVYQSYRRVRAGNIFLTGIEINGINPWMEVTYPVPATRETDVAAPNGELLVTWGYSRDAIFLGWEEQIFNVYFGTSPDELDSVAIEAEETEFLFTGLESGRTYYWRVDTQWNWEPWVPFFHGRTLEFTVA